MSKAKYIFITGGVTSSLGKGIISASLGKLLKSRGYSTTIQKLDPYINLDPGTMNPYEHGECFVTDDGAETDLDLGHYERFLDISTSKYNNLTAGRIYNNVITKERKGEYLGETVQVVPHITNEIKQNIFNLAQLSKCDFLIVEIGGSVGDIESLPFLEAIRQIKFSLESDRFVSVHLTLLPFLKKAGELKTKPTQYSVKQLQSYGIQTDIIVCRTEIPISENIRQKIANFCNVDKKSVIEAIDADTVYEVPLLMQNEELDLQVLRKLRCNNIPSPELESWKKFVNKLKKTSPCLNIGLIGKYIELKDAYKSIDEALQHASVLNDLGVKLHFISSEDFSIESLKTLDGIIIAPGFGKRGIEGKLKAIKYSRENNMPILGICLGMQCMVIEFARNVLLMHDANSTEHMPNTTNPVISIEYNQQSITQKGGTMRLGAKRCSIKLGSKTHNCYKKDSVLERHRHRYEFNNEYRKIFESAGMIFSGIDSESGLVEIIELSNHPWFIGVQFHPELKSTPMNPSPIFVNFLESIKQSKVQ